MNLSDSGQSRKLVEHPLSNNVTGVDSVNTHIDFQLFFLILLCIFVNRLDETHRYDRRDQTNGFLITHLRLIDDFLQHLAGLLHSVGVQVKLIPFVLAFDKLDFILVFLSDTECVMFASIRYRNPLVV